MDGYLIDDWPVSTSPFRVERVYEIDCLRHRRRWATWRHLQFSFWCTLVPMYTQKAGLIFGGNPARDKHAGCHCIGWHVGSVLWLPRMGTVRCQPRAQGGIFESRTFTYRPACCLTKWPVAQWGRPFTKQCNLTYAGQWAGRIANRSIG